MSSFSEFIEILACGKRLIRITETKVLTHAQHTVKIDTICVV